MSEDPTLPPRLDRAFLSHLEQDFHATYGATLAGWAQLEQTLCQLFCALCRFRPGAKLGPALFFSGRAFNTRADLMAAAVRSSKLKEHEKALVRAILKKARQ